MVSWACALVGSEAKSKAKEARAKNDRITGAVSLDKQGAQGDERFLP